MSRHSETIIVFSRMFWPQGGGSELATYLIVKTLLQEGFGVTVVSGTARPYTKGLRTMRYLHWSALEGNVKPFQWIRLALNKGTIAKLIRTSHILYIPSHNLYPLAIIAARINPVIKIIIHVHNYQPIRYNSVFFSGSRKIRSEQITSELYDHHSIGRAVATGLVMSANRINALALRRADRILFASERQMEIITSDLPWVRSKCVVIQNPPPSIRYRKMAPSNLPLFLYVGGSSLLKGFQLVLKTGAHLAERKSQAKILVAGHVSDAARSTITRLDPNERTFRLLGRIDHDQILRIQRKAWALLFPALSEEPSPYAVMEAMLSGTIPIASRVGGIPELMKGTAVEGFLFERGEMDQLLERIESVCGLSREQLVNIGEVVSEEASKRFRDRARKKALLRVFSC